MKEVCETVLTPFYLIKSEHMKKNYHILFFALLVCLSYQSIGQPVSDQLISLYTFREGTGEYVQDQSPYGEPLMLRILQPNNVSWIAGGGIRINQPALLKSLNNAYNIKEACSTSGKISIEAWVKPANTLQDGPSRIVAVSNNSTERNFLLSQRANTYSARLKTNTSNTEGTPSLDSPSNSVSTSSAQQVVFTRTANGQEKLHINSTQVASASGTGDFNAEGDCVQLPVLECVADATVECGQSTDPADTGQPLVNFTDEYILSYTDVSSGICPQVITRTWTATSISGGTVTCVQTITVVDTAAPTITYVPVITNSCWPQMQQSFQAIDNCDLNPNIEVVVLDSTWSSSAPCDPGSYRTQTQGGWGAAPNGNNPGAYLHANFASAFPNGLTIGCGNRLLTLTSPQAITDFLPSGSTPALLPVGTLTNPGGSYSNVLAGQLVAAMLNVGFDATMPNFSSANSPMSELVISQGLFTGSTLGELVNVANQIIGGCSFQYALADVNEALTLFNQNFDNGTVSNNYVSCGSGNVCLLTYTVQATATDACGNSTSITQNVQYTDTIAPTFTGWPAEMVVNCGQVPAPVENFQDECGGGLVTLSHTEVEFSGACLPTIERTYTAVDQCGNTSTFTQYIFVHDSQAPVFSSMPEDITIQCGEEFPYYDPVVLDNCDTDVIVTMTAQTAVDGCNRIITRVWTATDNCGNSSSVDQIITVVDNQGPEASAFEGLVELTCTDNFNFTDIIFTDACGQVMSVTFETTDSGTDCDHTYVRTYTATDECGNSTVVSQTIHVSDQEAPVFVSVPADLSLPCGSELPAGDAVASDNCGAVAITYSEQVQSTSNACAQVRRMWTATDACGNTAIAEQMVTFTDEIAPVLMGVPSDVQATCGALPAFAAVSATDNCDDQINVEFTESSTQNGCTITTVRTWSAADACGNTTSASQVITIADNAAPVITGEASVTVSCDQISAASVSVSDNCSPNVSLNYTESISGANCNQVITRTYVAIDGCGNTSQFVQTIQVVDNTAPVFSNIPADITLACGSAMPTSSPTAIDNCDADLNIIYTTTTSGEGCNLMVTRMWRVADDCGNQAMAVQVVSFVDNQSPVLVGVPANQTIPCDNYSYPTNSAVVSATDNCDLNLTVTYSEVNVPGTCPSNFSIVRTWSVTDACGNSASATQTIAVTDNTPPTFVNPPASITADCGSIPAPPTVTAIDNCSEVTVVMTEQTLSGGCPVIQRRWLATDACGNSAQWIQNVTVNDDEPPLLQGIPPGGPVTCNNIPPVPTPYAVDNCDDIVDVSINETIIGSGCQFTFIRTFIAEDDCGNSTIVSQSFFVTDDAPPVFINPQPNVTIQCGALPSYQGPSATDDCAGNVQITFTQTQEGSGCSYVIVRTYTATDLCGNTASFTQTINVVDTTPPVITGVPLNTFANCNTIPAPANPTAVDACGGAVTLVYNQTQQGTGCNTQLVRRWTATDNCGNSTVRTQLIYLIDNTPPVITNVPANMTLACGSALPPVVNPSVSDNCSFIATPPTLTLIETQTTSACAILVNRTWRATDACGNTAFATQQISFVDNVAPELVGVPADVYTTCGNIPPAAVVTATDNCASAVTINFIEEIIPGACPYTIRRTWVAMDACGQVDTGIQNIYVTDNEAPVLSAMPANMTVDCTDIPSMPTIAAFDNCVGPMDVDVSETVVELACGREIYRQWSVTDYCGNTATHTQVISVVDVSAPVFIDTPTTLTLECGAEIPEATVSYYDCSNVTLSMSEAYQYTDCEFVYSVTKTWTATDVCGNSASVSQLITVEDNLAPVFSAMPEDVYVDCSSIPTVPVITAVDQCQGEVEVTFVENTVYLEQANAGCEVNNANPVSGPIAIWLPNSLGYVSEYVFGTEPGSFTEDVAAGTAQITGVVYNPADTNQKWILNLNLINRRNWTQWNGMGRYYKDDAGFAGDHYLDWSYYELAANSQLIGAGSLAGSTLNLMHAPVSFRYGFQLGVGANNRSAAYGISGWFYYTGYINGTLAYGVGDLMTENSCCPDQDIVRTWRSFDCAGNSIVYTQTIHVGSNPTVLPMSAPDPAAADQLTVVNMNDQLQVNFNLYFDGQTKVKLYDMNANEVDIIYNASTEGGVMYQQYYDTSALPGGVYYVMLTQGSLTLTQRVVIVH